MRRFFLVLCVCVFLISNSIHAIALRPFSIAWRANPDSPANMSGLLDPPAGKHGYMRIDNGHFMQENGKRFRIWGINISSKACFPRKADAPIVAEHLARFGINCVRFHHMDNPSTNLLDGNPNDTRKLHPEVPDRLDFFIAELKKRGIYINLNLNVSRRFKAGDGVREYEYLGYGKGVTFFDERLIELQKEYARQLLTHRNPYTQTQYSKDPAVIIVEIVNENSLVESWISGRLLGQNTRKYPGTWTDIPPSYGKALTKQYNKWLKQRLSSAQLKQFRDEAGVRENAAVARLRPEQFANASRMRFHTEAAFYMQIEKDFFQDMYRFLKEELGVKAFIVGSSDHNHYRSGYPHLSATSLMDVVDGHVYWQHPSYHSGRRDGRRNFTIPNTPMVNDPLFSTVVQLSRTPVAGKPYTVSETNHPYPNEYACEGIPILAAYAALHDWDGIFFYTFEHAMPEDWRDTVRGHFDFRPDPMKMANLAAWAVTFLRGDVRSAENTIERSYSRDTVVETLRMPASQRPYLFAGLFSRNSLSPFHTHHLTKWQDQGIRRNTKQSKTCFRHTRAGLVYSRQGQSSCDN